MEWHLSQTGEEETILHLRGHLTVEHTEELRHVLLGIIADADTVTIEIDQDLETDIAGLQMLCSAHRTFVAKSKKLALRPGTPEPFRQLVRDAGLLRHQGCTLNPHNNCLWIGGNL